MLKESDEEWLREAHPALLPVGQGIAGTIEFRASYNHHTNCFRILGDEIADQTDSVTLSGAFQIQIRERTDKRISRLPALFIEGMEPTVDRHFSQGDQSACLCSPFEEDEFLEPELQVQSFLEQLVVPFLYGQVFYSSNGHWPWQEYAHGTTGILEAYSKIRDPRRAEDCLRRLADAPNWQQIKSALQQTPYTRGHTPCFCSKMDHIRRCHPAALDGALRLQRDLRILGIPT